MQQETSSKVLGVALVCLIIGVLGGYFYGDSQGVKKGVAQEKAAIAAEQKKAADAAAQAASPFGGTSVNPFSAPAPVNPYKDVKVNPFQ